VRQFCESVEAGDGECDVGLPGSHHQTSQRSVICGVTLASLQSASKWSIQYDDQSQLCNYSTEDYAIRVIDCSALACGLSEALLFVDIALVANS